MLYDTQFILIIMVVPSNHDLNEYKKVTFEEKT